MPRPPSQEHCCDTCRRLSGQDVPVEHGADWDRMNSSYRHEGSIRFSKRHLKQMLRLPEHWSLHGVRQDAWVGVVEFLFAAPELPPVGEGCIPPIMETTICVGEKGVA